MAVRAETLGEIEAAERQPLTEAARETEHQVIGFNGLPLELAQSDILRQVDIIGIREGGLVECYVPFGLIDNEEVPVKEEWAASLAKQMGEIAKVEGGTGQHVPVTLGLIEGEPSLKIMDGFHRSAALRHRGEDRVYATVKLTDWNDLYDFRIFTAKDHAHVRFSRVVQWIREVWNYSGLEGKLSVEQAVLLYRYDTDGSKLGLKPEDVVAAKKWVAHKEAGWEIASMTIHSYLKVAESVDPALVHSTREKRRGDILEAPTQNILKVFADEMPNNFMLQNFVMETAKSVRLPNAKGGTRSMSGPEIRALCQKVKGCENIEDAQAAIAGIDWDTWEPEYGESKQRALRRAHDPRHKGAAALSNTLKEVGSVRQRVQLTKERNEDISELQKRMIEQAREQAKDIIREVGSLVIELSELLGEEVKLEAHRVVAKQPKPQPEVACLPAQREREYLARRRAQTEIDEHEGLAMLVGRQHEQGLKPATIHEAVLRYMKGEIDIMEVPDPRTHAERRQFKVALSLAVDIAEKDRLEDWTERFQELRMLENPSLADIN